MRTPGQIAIAYNTSGEGGGAAAPAASTTGADASNAGSSTDTAAPSSTPSDTGTNDGVNDFMGMGVDDFDDLEALPSESAPTEAKPPVTPAAPAAQEPAKPVAQKPAVAEAKPAATPPAPVAGQQEAPASPPPAGPQSLVEAMDANREALIDAISKDMFSMSKEEAEALETDFAGNLPKLGARVFYQATRATHNIINSLVPQLIEKHLGAIKKREETENAFYGQFKGLDKTKHHADVVQFAQTFRQVNPNATREELWALVASSVAAKHGLTSAQAAQVVADAANGSQPRRPPASEPFVPARPGAVVKSTPEPENAWDGLGKNFDEDG
jgi:hypothetical protein